MLVRFENRSFIARLAEQNPAPIVDELGNVDGPIDLSDLTENRFEELVEDDLPVEADDQIMDVGTRTEIVIPFRHVLRRAHRLITHREHAAKLLVQTFIGVRPRRGHFPPQWRLTPLQLSRCKRTRKAVSPLDWGQVFPRSWEVRRKTLELFEVKSRKNLQSFSAVFCEMQSDNPVIVFVSGPTHQTGHNDAVNETYRTVVDKEQIVGYFSDRRTTGVIMPSDGQQQLVLGGSEACDRAWLSLQRSKWRSPVRKASRRA